MVTRSNTTHTETHRLIKLLMLTVAKFVMFSSLSIVHAAPKVVVVPLLGDDATRPAQVVVVAKRDGDFTDPIAAVSSVGDASEIKPYVVYIAPGVYTLSNTLQLKPHVRIVGSGIGTTVLKGAIGAATLSASAALINGANDAALSSLSLINDGTSSVSAGVYMDGSSPTLDDLQIQITSGSSAAYGAYVRNARPIIKNSKIEAKSSSTDGTSIYGLNLLNAQGTYRNLTIFADAADTSVVPRATKAFALAAENSRLELSHVRLTAIDAPISRSVYTVGTSYVNVKDNSGFFTSGTDINANDTSTIVIKNSDFFSGVGVKKAPAATVICLFSTEGETNILDANCEP